MNHMKTQLAQKIMKNEFLTKEKHFKYKEFINSYLLEEFNTKNINKQINNEIDTSRKYNNIIRVAEQLEIVRSAINEPIHISSGYRCKELNMLVGGKLDSYHLVGCAADIKIIGNVLNMYNVILKLQKENKTNFDYVIYYPNQNFIHVQIVKTVSTVPRKKYIVIKK
jgi:zinc D-Ala-D-Ala carboxypeptidase